MRAVLGGVRRRNSNARTTAAPQRVFIYGCIVGSPEPCDCNGACSAWFDMGSPAHAEFVRNHTGPGPGPLEIVGQVTIGTAMGLSYFHGHFPPITPQTLKSAKPFLQ